MGKLISLIGVKPGETKLACLSAFYALLIGLSQVWLKTIPVSLFLTHFDAATLPYAYIGSALVLVLLGIVYSALEKRLTAIRLLYIFIILPAAVFFVLWAFLQGFPNKWLYLLLFICASSSFDIFDLELWGMLNRLFTLDQAKRMFGTIGLCQSLAGIAGNFLIPLLLILIGPINIILTVSLCITCATLLLSVIFRYHSERFRNPTEKGNIEEVRESSKVKWWKNSYLINNMLFAIFSLFVYTIVDISFYNVNKVVYPTEIQMASFLGIFFGISNVFDLLCRGVVGPLVINKLGIKAGLLIRSIAVGGVALAILLLLPFNINFYFIFLLVALMKLFDEGISNSILRQSVLILYQPLLPKLRSWLQSKIELFVIPLSTIAASLIFIVIQYYFNLNLAYITLLILAVIIATLKVTFSLQKGYVENLQQALAKQFIIFKSRILDKNYKDLILEKLAHGNSYESIYCLDLLEKMDRSFLVDGLRMCLVNSNPLIKKAALIKLKNFQSNELILDIKKILKEDSDASLRGQAFRALSAQKEKAIDHELQAYLDSEDHVLSDEAILATLQYSQDPKLQLKSRDKLHKLIHSQSASDRIRAVKIIQQLDANHDQDLLSLFDDKDPSVTIAVIDAVPSLQDNKLYQKLAKALDRKELRSSVIQAFIKAEDKGLSTLTDSLAFAIEKKDFRRTHSIFSIIGYLQTPSAIQLLLQNLRMKKDPSLQWQILQALDISGYQASLLTEKQELDLFLREAADYLDKLLKWNRQVINQKGYELLAATLKRQIQSSQKQIFLFLGLLYPKKVIRDIAFYFKHSDIDKVSYAHEFLENILSKEHKSMLLPLFAQCHVDHLIQKPSSIPDVESLFKEILACPTYEITLSLKATVLYLIARLQLKQISQIAQEEVSDPFEIVSETAKWALINLNKGKNS